MNLHRWYIGYTEDEAPLLGEVLTELGKITDFTLHKTMGSVNAVPEFSSVLEVVMSIEDEAETLYEVNRALEGYLNGTTQNSILYIKIPVQAHLHPTTGGN